MRPQNFRVLINMHIQRVCMRPGLLGTLGMCESEEPLRRETTVTCPATSASRLPLPRQPTSRYLVIPSPVTSIYSPDSKGSCVGIRAVSH